MCGSYHNTAFPSRWRLQCTPTYTPHRYGLRRRSPSAPLTTSIGLTSRVVSPAWPSLYREPLRPFEALPRWGPPCCGLGRRYPALIAPMGSCARPPPSRVLRTMAWYASLCRLPRAPGHLKSRGRLTLGEALGLHSAILLTALRAFEAPPGLVAILGAALLVLDDGSHRFLPLPSHCLDDTQWRRMASALSCGNPSRC